MLHLAGVLGRSSKIRSFGARFALGAARARRYREIYRPTPPNPRKIGRAFHPAAGARSEPCVTAAARTATRHACGSSISHALRRRPARLCATPAATQTASRYLALPPRPARQRATAATQSSTRYGGSSPHKKRGRCQSNGPAQTMRYISLRKRFLISSTLASRGLPGAQASA